MSKVIIQECKDYSPDDVIDKINSGIEKLADGTFLLRKEMLFYLR